MKVKDLITQLSEYPQDCEVVVTGFDHTYDVVSGTSIRTAEKISPSQYSEWAEGYESEYPVVKVVEIW